MDGDKEKLRIDMRDNLKNNKQLSGIERSCCVLDKLNKLFKVNNINFIISDDPVSGVLSYR